MARKKKKTELVKDQEGRTFDDVLKEMGIQGGNENGHYVDNKKLYAHLCEYCKQRDYNAEHGLEKPRLDDYIGKCILLIATHLSFRPNFINYSYREDMIGDAVDNCLKYIDSFDPNKSENAFAYITQICWCAFIRCLKIEKRNSVIKGRIMLDNNQDFENPCYVQEDDGDDLYLDNAYNHTFVELAQQEHQKSIEKKKEAKKERDAKKRKANMTVLDKLLNS